MDLLSKNNNERLKKKKDINYKKYLLTQLIMENDFNSFYSELTVSFSDLNNFIEEFKEYYEKKHLFNSYTLFFSGNDDDYINDEHKNYCEMFNLFIFSYGFVIEMYKKYKDIKKNDIFSLFLDIFTQNEDIFYRRIETKFNEIFIKFLDDIYTSIDLDSSQINYFNDDLKYVLNHYIEVFVPNQKLINMMEHFYNRNSFEIIDRIKIQTKILTYYSEKNIFKLEIFDNLSKDTVKYTEQVRKTLIIDPTIFIEIDKILKYISKYYENYPINEISILLWSIIWNIKMFCNEDINILLVSTLIHNITDNLFICITKMIFNDYDILNTFFTRYLIRFIIDIYSIKTNACTIFTTDIPFIFSKIVKDEKHLKHIASIIDKDELPKLKDIISEEYYIILDNMIDKINELVESDEESKYTDMITSTYIIEPFPLHNGNELIFLDKYQVMLNSLENGINPFNRDKMDIYDVINIYNDSLEMIKNFKKQQIEYEKNKSVNK
jgi:hypothetical protein